MSLNYDKRSESDLTWLIDSAVKASNPTPLVREVVRGGPLFFQEEVYTRMCVLFREDAQNHRGGVPSLGHSVKSHIDCLQQVRLFLKARVDIDFFISFRVCSQAELCGKA